jgi:hypothetical protein
VAKVSTCNCKDPTGVTLCVVCVAGILHCAPKTVYKMAQHGKIPSVPTSQRHRFFLKESILYWVKNQEIGLAA